MLVEALDNLAAEDLVVGRDGMFVPPAGVALGSDTRPGSPGVRAGDDRRAAADRVVLDEADPIVDIGASRLTMRGQYTPVARRLGSKT